MWHPGLLTLVAVFGTALLVCSGLILTQRWHGKLTLDHDLNGVQKIHHRPVPRIGGVALFAALLTGGSAAWWFDDPLTPQILTLLACGIPAFLAGLFEDLTKRVGVRTRLYASFISAIFAVWAMGAHLTRLDTPGLDYVISFLPVSVFFTCFAVGGITNSVNIIDGLNGLAAGSVLLMLAGLAAMAWMVGDPLVLKLCLLGMVAMAGFLLLNYPFGRIFLGDGGAYLAGFWLAECAVLLLVRNPGVSTWAVLLACFYPFWETAYSIYRRHIVGRVSSGQADMGHLHHLIFKRISTSGLVPSVPAWLRHGVTSGIIWMMVLGCQLIAVTFTENTLVLALFTATMAIVYHTAYGRLSADDQFTQSSDNGVITVKSV